jgi:hypothetical protein
MSAELSFNSNIVQILLVIGIILLAGGYFYYENIKMKNHLLEFEYKLDKLSELIYPGNKDSQNQPQNQPQNQSEDLSNLNIQMESMMPNNLTSLFNPIEGLINEVPKEDLSKGVEDLPDVPSKDLPIVEDKNDSEWSDIDKQMKNDDPLTEDKKETPSDPVELESFSIDEMLKDISEENKGGNESISEQNGESTDKIIDISGDDDYKNMTVSQLKDILIEKNLPVSGNKTKLIQRILDNDK